MNIKTRTYESLLPFPVVEAISARGQTYRTVSARMVDNGWAWLVRGRQLFVWKYKNSTTASVRTRRTLSQCFELQLPQSDLLHRAELAHVFFMPQNPNTSSRSITVPTALSVSPDGIIRLWSSVASERFAEAPICDIQGQEFCTLVALSSLEYLLGTTTGSIFLLSINVNAHDSKGILPCSPLCTPSGLLSGIGRRLTNVFFGQMPTDVSADNRRPLISVPKYSQSTIDKTGSTDRPFFVMSSALKLRQWSRTTDAANRTNHLIREWDLYENMFAKITSELNLSPIERLNFWPIDMVTTKTNELLILIVIVDASRNNSINYATCLFNPYQAGDKLTRLTILRSHSWQYSNQTEEQLLSLRFLERRTTSNVCFMFDRNFLFLIKVDEDVLDAIDYAIQDDSILGAGMIEDHPILFTQRDGLICVEPVISNKSRLNETSIQIEAQHPSTSVLQQSRHEQSRQQSRLEPMIVELDDENENGEDAENISSAPDVSKMPGDRSQAAMTDKSLNQSDLSRSIDKTPRPKRGGIQDLIGDNKEFEWVQQIDDRQYRLASETLEKLAVESEILKDRRDTLLALGKLAALAE